VIYVKANSPYKDIKDLKGKTIGFVDPNSTSGYNAPRFFLHKVGIDADAFFGKSIITGSHENGVIALDKGTVDCAADIRAGRTVIVNVSRTVISAMRRAYADVVAVSITAPSEVLAARIAMRARGSDGRLEQRLGRTVEDAAAAPDVTIMNVCSVDYHARQLVRIIKGERWDE
jgi:phosphate/phosphite/phosphonate ABC transporter binding protein